MVASAKHQPSTVAAMHITSLLLLSLLPSLTSAAANNGRVSVLRSYFRCPDCEQKVCPPPASDGCQLIRELGVCSCCLVCARQLGEPCGIYTEPCAKGLKCASPGDNSIEPLFYGDGVCHKTSTSEGGHFDVNPSMN